MNYDVLVFIVLANVVVTLSLLQAMGRKANKPPGLNKKAAKLPWDSEPIKPKHEPPSPDAPFARIALDDHPRFFADFKEFADVVNWWLEEPFVQSCWRLQGLPDWDCRIGVGDPPLRHRRDRQRQLALQES